MIRHRFFLVFFTLAVWAPTGCVPVAVPPPPTAEEQQRAYDEERYPAQVIYNPSAPQAISGFFRMGRVYSATMGTADVLLQTGNPRDLDMMIDTVNEYTDVRADFAPDLPYGDPRIFDLPIIIPQSPPNEAELEQLSRYLLEGGFVLDAALGFEVLREGLEKYAGLVWGRDAWVDRVRGEHPLYRAFFTLDVGESALPSQMGVQGLFVRDRLVAVAFDALGVRAERERPGPEISPQMLNPGQDLSPGALALNEQLIREINQAKRERLSDIRFQQMAVNVVVFALTQEGSIARRDSTQ